MKTTWRFLGVTVVLALVAATLSRIIWPDIPDMAGPTGGQLPLFILMSIIEAVALGAGVALLIFGWSWMRAFPGALSKLAFLSVVWSLVSWWPHDNMHRVLAHNDYW